MSGWDAMGGEHLGLLASSGTSTSTLLVIVIGQALVIGLLIVLVVMLRRNLQSAKSRRDPDAAFVSGSLEMPLTRPAAPVGAPAPGPASAAPASAIPPPPDSAPPPPPAGAEYEPPVPPPAVSWDMTPQEEEEILDPENVPIPAYTGPKLAPISQGVGVDFNLGVEDPPEEIPSSAAEAAAVAAQSDAGASGSRWQLRRSKRAGQAPPPPFT